MRIPDHLDDEDNFSFGKLDREAVGTPDLREPSTESWFDQFLTDPEVHESTEGEGEGESSSISEAFHTYKWRSENWGSDDCDTLEAGIELANALIEGGKSEVALRPLKNVLLRLGSGEAELRFRANWSLAIALAQTGDDVSALALRREIVLHQEKNPEGGSENELRAKKNLANSLEATGDSHAALQQWRVIKSICAPEREDQRDWLEEANSEIERLETSAI
jgi:hypothetical protein